MGEGSRVVRFLNILICIVMALLYAIIMPRFDSNRSAAMIFLTVMLVTSFIRERGLIKRGKEKVGEVSRIILVAGPWVTLFTGVISVLLLIKQMSEMGVDGAFIPMYYFFIVILAGLGYFYVLYDEKAHEGEEK